MPIKLLLLNCCLLFNCLLYSQVNLIQIDNGKYAEVPFEFANNFMVVEILFNNSLPLKFIFDTGAENTLLTQRAITDLLAVNYDRSIPLYGSDLTTELQAHVATDVSLQLGDDLTLNSHSLLVLDQDYFRFEEHTGMEIHGILGADILRRFVIHINFRARKITFQNPAHFKTPKSYIQPVSEFDRHKPYLYINTLIQQADDDQNLKLLLDTGASLALLLYTGKDRSIELPEHCIRSNIGFGLGGQLEGAIGRTAEIAIGEQKLQHIVTCFQYLDEELIVDPTTLNSRNGIMGNGISLKFDIVIDYIREKVYLKPNRHFKKKFTYDRSGINLITTGPYLNNFTVLNVVKGSPADMVGIQKGDEIIKVNGLAASLRGLQAINRIFQKKAGRRIKISYKRAGQKYKTELVLRDLI